LTHDGISTAPAWSPDGKAIAFINSQGHNDVYLVDANGGVPQALTNDPAPDGIPGFSRDGRWVYFSSKRDGPFRLWRISTANGALEDISHNGGEVRESTDGWIYLTNLWGGTVERMRPDGHAREVLVDGLPIPVSWTLWRDSIPLVRKGDQILRVDPSTRQTSLFWRLDPSTVTPYVAPTTISRANEGCTAFDVSPDGQSIVYCQSRPQGDIILVENFR
jgi:Tol biopolymer transport system component